MDEPLAPERRLKRLRLALLLSLAVNLLVLGVIGGAMLNMRKSGSERVATIDGPNPFLRAMTRDDARQLRRALNRELGAPRERRAAARANMQALIAELRSDSFTAEGLTARFEALNAGISKQAQAGQKVVLDHLVTLDAEARADFADRLEEALARGPRGDKGQRRPPRRD